MIDYTHIDADIQIHVHKCTYPFTYSHIYSHLQTILTNTRRALDFSICDRTCVLDAKTVNVYIHEAK